MSNTSSQNFYRNFVSRLPYFSNEKNICTISKKYRYRLTNTFISKFILFSLSLSLLSLQINPHEWFHSTFTSSANTQLIQRCFYRDLYLYEGWLFPLDFSPPRIPRSKNGPLLRSRAPRDSNWNVYSLLSFLSTHKGFLPLYSGPVITKLIGNLLPAVVPRKGKNLQYVENS